MATEIEAWWQCPRCDSHTETHEGPPPHRTCTTCDWSVSIPTPANADKTEVDDGR